MDLQNRAKQTRDVIEKKSKTFSFIGLATTPLLPTLHLRPLPIPRLPQTPFCFTSTLADVL
jgi:hypothetical protein